MSITPVTSVLPYTDRNCHQELVVQDLGSTAASSLPINLEQLMHETHKLILSTYLTRTNHEKQMLIFEQNLAAQLQRKKWRHHEEDETHHHYMRGVQTIDKVVDTVGFVFTAIELAIAKPSPVAIMALLGTGIVMIDSLADHVGKKHLAQLLANLSDSKEAWLDKLKAASGILSLSSSIIIPNSGATSAIVMASKSANSALKAWVDHRLRSVQKERIQHDLVTQFSDIRMQQHIERMKSTQSSHYESYKTMYDAVRRWHSVSAKIHKRG